MTPQKRPSYRIRINSKHDANVQFATLVHELAHLYLGHLGDDAYLKIPDRTFLGHSDREVEAESVSYLVCHRADVYSEAEQYLAKFMSAGTSLDKIDVYALMRAAGQIETALGIAAHSKMI